ncbi:MAG: helix-turn-helix domain-containing protein [bacterium]|nr:helix-turn-helix domain-containing protein [bacterium]
MEHETRSRSTAGITEAVPGDRQAIHEVQQALSQAAVGSQGTAFLVAPSGERIPLPMPLFQILRQAARLLSNGDSVSIAPIHKELTTQEAADLLNVSRPFLIKLLDQGKIAFVRAGRHRRVRFGDVMKYKQERQVERKRILQELIRQQEEDGLYDQEEFELPSTR